MKSKSIGRYSTAFCSIVIILGAVCCSSVNDSEVFQTKWPEDIERPWIGPDFWANRLQDWRIKDGRIECQTGTETKPMRTVHLLTRELVKGDGTLRMTIQLGAITSNGHLAPDAAAGFLIGTAPRLDHRARALIHHSSGPGAGLFLGIDGEGQLFIRDFSKTDAVIALQDSTPGFPAACELHMVCQAKGSECSVRLESRNLQTGERIGSMNLDNPFPVESITGGIAIVSHPGTGESTSRFWFKDWRIEGDKIAVNNDRNCGPVLSTQYTLSQNRLRLTAQLMPIGTADLQEVEFQILTANDWLTLDTAEVVHPGYTATFQVEEWDGSRDFPYRVSYRLKQEHGSPVEFLYTGTVRKEPLEKEEIIVAAFTGNHNAQGGVDRGTFPWDTGLWFPHTDIISQVNAHSPDVLFFSGDQVYEGASPTAADFADPFLDYLYKWYLWCWAFRDLTRDIPAITIPDDHDVFHGNLWGAGGKPAERGKTGAEAQDSGGYKLSPEFVNMVERTQTSHFPPPFDPTPVLQGVGVYYCRMDYGGVSFAVIEDRKFKSAPKSLLPKGEIWNGWPQSDRFDAKNDADHPEAQLLGSRQLLFLEEWIPDWSDGIWMKVLLSQTLFSNVATLPRGSKSGSVIPNLPTLKRDEYAVDDVPVADMDSNGWPQSGRNRALRILRKGFAAHISGDQHLGSTIQYGIEEWKDAGYALCVPSVANFWPRRWYPVFPGKNRIPGSPRYTGDYEDGFGNKMTVYAVSNPTLTGQEPSRLHDRSPGYGIARFFRSSRKIVYENWPRWADPSSPEGKPYPGWPIEFQQEDNFGKGAHAYLPKISVGGISNPVIQIIDEKTEDIVYTLRLKTSTYRPRVFKPGLYTIKIGEPGTSKMSILNNVQSVGADDRKEIHFEFEKIH